MSLWILPRLQMVERLHQLLTKLQQNGSQLLRLWADLIDPIEHNGGRGFLRQVNHVVDRAGQSVDVLPVEGVRKV
jgi:hypothetical protein